MNLPRLRELHKMLVDGSMRDAERDELRDMLPEVIEMAEKGEAFVGALRSMQESHDHRPPVPTIQFVDVQPFDYDGYAGRFGY